MSDEFQDAHKATSTAPSIGWLVSETYRIVKEMAEPKLTVGEQVAQAEAALNKSRVAFLDVEVAALRQRIAELVEERDMLRSVNEGHVEDKAAYRERIGELTEMVRTPTMAITNEPNLGLASTEQMMRELITRFKLAVPQTDVTWLLNINRAMDLAEMLGGMSAPEREYRTVDHD